MHALQQLGRFLLTGALFFLLLPADQAPAQAPVNVGFLWHMHQPQYRPGENVLQTDASGAFSFSIADVHNQRLGPYRSWPKDAVQSGSSLPHLGRKFRSQAR